MAVLAAPPQPQELGSFQSKLLPIATYLKFALHSVNVSLKTPPSAEGNLTGSKVVPKVEPSNTKSLSGRQIHQLHLLNTLVRLRRGWIRNRHWRLLLLLLLSFLLLLSSILCLLIPIAHFCVEGSLITEKPSTSSPTFLESSSSDWIMLHPTRKGSNNLPSSRVTRINNNLAVTATTALGFAAPPADLNAALKSSGALAAKIERRKFGHEKQVVTNFTLTANEKVMSGADSGSSNIAVHASWNANLAVINVNHSDAFKSTEREQGREYIGEEELGRLELELEREQDDEKEEKVDEEEDAAAEDEVVVADDDDDNDDDYNDYGAYIIYEQAADNNSLPASTELTQAADLAGRQENQAAYNQQEEGLTRDSKRGSSIFFAAMPPHKLTTTTRPATWRSRKSTNKSGFTIVGELLASSERSPGREIASLGDLGEASTEDDVPKRQSMMSSSPIGLSNWNSNGASFAPESVFSKEQGISESLSSIAPHSSRLIDSRGKIRVPGIRGSVQKEDCDADDDFNGKAGTNRSRRHQQQQQQRFLKLAVSRSVHPQTLELSFGAKESAGELITSGNEAPQERPEGSKLPEQLDKDDIKWLSEMTRRSFKGADQVDSLLLAIQPARELVRPSEGRKEQTERVSSTTLNSRDQLKLYPKQIAETGAAHAPLIAGGNLSLLQPLALSQNPTATTNPISNSNSNSNFILKQHNNSSSSSSSNSNNDAAAREASKGSKTLDDVNAYDEQPAQTQKQVAQQEEEEEEEPVIEKHNIYYWRLVCFILPLGATFGNLLVIMAVYRERSLQSVTNYFIVSLAFADLFVGLVVMPFAVYVLVNEVWELSDTICDIFVAVDVTSSTASILNLVAISIDRYRAVAYPIAYTTSSSSTIAALTICGVWLISCAVGAPIIFGLNTTPGRKSTLCILYNSTYIFWSSLASFYIPCIAMIALYWRIFSAIRSRTKKAIQAARPAVGVGGASGSLARADASGGPAHCRMLAGAAYRQHQHRRPAHSVNPTTSRATPEPLKSSSALGASSETSASSSATTKPPAEPSGGVREDPELSVSTSAAILVQASQVQDQNHSHRHRHRHRHQHQQQNQHPSITESSELASGCLQVSSSSRPPATCAASQLSPAHLTRCANPCQSPDRSAPLSSRLPECPLGRRIFSTSVTFPAANVEPTGALKPALKLQHETRERHGCSQLDGEHPSSGDGESAASSSVVASSRLEQQQQQQQRKASHSSASSFLLRLDQTQVDWCSCRLTESDQASISVHRQQQSDSLQICVARFLSRLANARSVPLSSPVTQSDLDCWVGVLALLAAIPLTQEQLNSGYRALEVELLKVNQGDQQPADSRKDHLACSSTCNFTRSLRVTKISDGLDDVSSTSSVQKSKLEKQLLSPSFQQSHQEALRSKLNSLLLSHAKLTTCIALAGDHCQLTQANCIKLPSTTTNNVSASPELSCRCCLRAFSGSTGQLKLIPQLTSALSSLICLIEPEEGAARAPVTAIDNHCDVKVTFLIQQIHLEEESSKAKSRKMREQTAFQLGAFYAQLNSSFLAAIRASSVLLASDRDKFLASSESAQNPPFTWRRPTCRLAHLCQECQASCVLCAAFGVTDSPAPTTTTAGTSNTANNSTNLASCSLADSKSRQQHQHEPAGHRSTVEAQIAPIELKCSHLSKLLKEEQRNKHPNLNLEECYLPESSDPESEHSSDSSAENSQEETNNTRSGSRSSSSSSFSTNFRIGGSYNSASSFTGTGTGGNCGYSRSEEATDGTQHHLSSSQCCQLPLSHHSSCTCEDQLAPPGGSSTNDVHPRSDSRYTQSVPHCRKSSYNCTCSCSIQLSASKVLSACPGSHQLAPDSAATKPHYRCSTNNTITDNQHQPEDSSILSTHMSTCEAFGETMVTTSNQQLSSSFITSTSTPGHAHPPVTFTTATATTTGASTTSNLHSSLGFSPLPSPVSPEIEEHLSEQVNQSNGHLKSSARRASNEPIPSKCAQHHSHSIIRGRLDGHQQATGILQTATEKIKRRSMRLSQLIRGCRTESTVANSKQKTITACQSNENTDHLDENLDSSSAAVQAIANTNSTTTKLNSVAIGFLTSEPAIRDTSSSLTTSQKDANSRINLYSASAAADTIIAANVAPIIAESQLVMQTATSNLTLDVAPSNDNNPNLRGTATTLDYLKNETPAGSESHFMSTLANLLHIKQHPRQNKHENRTKDSSIKPVIPNRHQAGSRKRREKTAARRERKATKTLAIVLGIFLICWTPFFTCNIIDGICIQLDMDCRPGMMVYQVTSWLGYINSCVNPIIYTIFNMEFRRAFKKIICTRPKCC